jgi:hypothetical protein
MNTLRIILAAILMLPLTGCEIVGVMADTYQRTGTHEVLAEYEGLEGETFAVFIAADRVIQAENPRLVPRLTTAITAQLIANVPAAGYVPAPLVLDYKFNNPSWPARPYAEIAEELGVTRLIIIDLYEYRLNEVGNSYLWDGVLAGNLGVAEADGAFPNDLIYTKGVAVRFPDGEGFGPDDITAQQINAVLERRFTNRATWLFYDHEEDNDPDY